MQSRSVLQLYYADHAFTDSLRTVCQNAISSIQDDENDTDFNQLFIDLEEYWKTDHNIEVMLTVPSSIGSDKPINNISLFLNYLPLVNMNSTTQPKTSGAKISFCDRLTADWTNQRVRIAFRMAIDVIYATFSTLVLQNNKLSVGEVESVITQMQNYLDLDNEYPDSGKFRIISSRYFSKVIGVLSKMQPEFVFNNFFSSLKEIVKTIKKSSQEIDQKYLLNIVLCLHSNLKTDNSQFPIDTKQYDKVFSSLFSILSKKSLYDSTLQKDACTCLINFFGVILTDRPALRDSNFLNNMIKLTYSHSKIFSVFFMLETLLYCFDKSKHMASDKKKFLSKIFSKKRNTEGDALNVFTYFLRGELYVSKSEIDFRNTSLTEKNFLWVPDPCINQETLNKMSQFIFTDPKAFTSYQSELSDFLIQYASLNYTAFINNFLEKILDMSFFKPNTMAVISVGKALLIAGKKSSISKDLINKMHRILTTAVSQVMKNSIADEGKSCVALHVQSFWPIYVSHEMNYNVSISHITQCCNPLAIHIHPETLTKIIKPKWAQCSSSVKTTIFDLVGLPLQIYNNVSTTNQLLINVMTIIPHFPNEKTLIKEVVSLIFSPLTDVSALAIRLMQTILIKSNDCNIFEYILTEAFNLNKCTHEILYLMLYTIDQLLDLAINLRLNFDDNIIDKINFGVIISLCSQNVGVHTICFSVLAHLNSIQPINSIEYLLEKYDTFISYQSKRSALLTVSQSDTFIQDAPNILFKSMSKSNYARLYLFYIASLGRCFSVESEDMNTKSLLTMILQLNLTDQKWDPFIYTGIVTFLVNAFNISMSYDDPDFFKNFKTKVCDVLLKDPRLDEWNGFHIFSAVDCAIDPSMIKLNILSQNQDQSNKKYHEENARYRYNSTILTDDELNSIGFNSDKNEATSILRDQGNKNDDSAFNFEWFSIKPSSNVIAQAISLGIRTSIADNIEIETATNYMTYLSSIVKYFKKSKLVHSKLTFSYSSSVFAQFESVVRVVLDTAAALFSVFYERLKKVPAGPYMRKEIVGKNVSIYFDIEQWFSFILNFIPHKPKKSLVSASTKKGESINPVRESALNALSSLLSISPPPNTIYSKFIKNSSKYDDRSLSLILSYYTSKLLPTFVRKALSPEYIHSTRYFHAIVNQFTDILPKDFIPKLMNNTFISSPMSSDEISFADTFFAHTGTIIALAFTRITTDDKESRRQAFTLLFNVAVGAAAYLNKPESVVRISDQMQSLMFTITSQLTSLYMSALQSISMLLSQELNIVSEQLISIILDSMANGGNSVLLASILAPWIKGAKFDDDTPIVFTATQQQFACFTRFSFARSFSRIKLTTSLFFVIDSLLTTPGAASFLTIALSSLFQSDQLSSLNVTSTISYILQQRPSECVPLVTSLFMFSAWFYYNIQLKSTDSSKPNEIKLTKPKARKSSGDKQSSKAGDKPTSPKKAIKHKHQTSFVSRGSTVLNVSSLHLTPPDSPDLPKLHSSSSDPNLAKKFEKLNESFQDNESIYENVIQYAVTTISSTNLEIYNGYEHRLLAHALITLDSTRSSSLVPFLIPKLAVILKKVNANNDNIGRERNKSNADVGLLSNENLNENGPNSTSLFDNNQTNSFNKLNSIDFETIVMKEIRNKGTEFAQKLGMECLTWGLCCSNLNYAIRALFLYRKILMPTNLQIINKLIDCLKLASNAHKENRNDTETAELLKSYVENCLETIRLIAFKIDVRTVELWDLCIDFIAVNNPEIQTIAFNFLTFLVSDLNFVRTHIHIVSKNSKNDEDDEKSEDDQNNHKKFFKITASALDQINNEPPKLVTNLINKIYCTFDKESFLAFFNFVLCTSYNDLYEIVGSPELVSVFVLLLLPIINTYNNNNSNSANETIQSNVNTNNTNNAEMLSNSLTLSSRGKSRRKSIVTIDGQRRRSSLAEKTDKISKLVYDRFQKNNSNMENNEGSMNNNPNTNNTDVDLSFFTLFEAKIDDFMSANKLNEISQMNVDDINEENILDAALYIALNLLDKNELITLCKFLSAALSFSSSTTSNNNLNLNLNSNSNININSNSNLSLNSSQSSAAADTQSLIYADNSYIYKFALEMVKSGKFDPSIFIPIAKAEDTNAYNFQAKEELINEIQNVSGIDLNSLPMSNLFIDSSTEINSESQNTPKTDENNNNDHDNCEVLSSSVIVNLPTYLKHPINNSFTSSNDFASINILPPLYISNIKDCRSNVAVLKAIQRIRSQPLNDWTDLMFKAETTATQVEVLKSRKKNRVFYFNDRLFLKQLRTVISSKSKAQEKQRERKISNDFITLNDNDNDFNIANFDLNVLINESFALDVDDIDQIWKESIKNSGNNFDTLSSIKL